MLNAQKVDHYFRFQSGSDIPVSGDLSQVILELCHKISLIELDGFGNPTGEILGGSQGKGILNLGTVEELNAKYPQLLEYLNYVRDALVAEATLIIQEQTDGL